MKRLRVCHVSSVHPANDVRIFRKECVSLAAEETWEVHLIGNGPLEVGNSNVFFHPLPKKKPSNRLLRMVLRSWQAYSCAKHLDADLYHIHDPELLPWAYALKLSGKKVVYDAHEDVPRDIMTKQWLPKVLRQSVSWLFERFENTISKRLDMVIAATPHIRARFQRVTDNVIDVNNYPWMREFASEPRWEEKRQQVCYVGAITLIRGIREMCSAMSIVQSDAKLNLCGEFSDPSLRQLVSEHEGWKRVIDHGLVSSKQANEIMSLSLAGIVVFHECANHVDAQPNKLFEYMGAGIAVIASDFPLWRKIIQANDCGLMVNPSDSKAIANAIDFLVNNPVEAKRLGSNGKRVVQERYNWESESRKLIHAYKELISR